MIMSVTLTPIPYLVQIHLWGGLWAKGLNIFFIYALSGTHLQVRLSDGFSCLMMAQTMDVPFGYLVDIATHVGGQIIQKFKFWCMNRLFLAKCGKY